MAWRVLVQDDESAYTVPSVGFRVPCRQRKEI